MGNPQKPVAAASTEERHEAESKFRISTANTFVIGYVLFILCAMVLGGISLFHGKDMISNLKDLIITISGIFSGPLGLVIGYFFRTEQQNTARVRSK